MRLLKFHTHVFTSIVLSILILILFLFYSCGNVVSNSEKNKKDISKEINKKAEQKLIITYHFDTIRNDSALKVFKTKYSAVQQKIIAASNRIDVGRIRVKTILVIPDTLFSDFMAYVPFPATLILPDSVIKFILINQRIQLFAAYENGKIVQSGPVSSGRKSKPTPNGLFYSNFKAKKKRSTVDGDWIMPWYFNISNKGGVAMHQFFLPGYPASHSCIRMYEEDAKWIFDWAEQWEISENGTAVIKNGTPVLVFGKYDFDQLAPWKLLPKNPNALELTEEELNTIKNIIPTIKIFH